MLVDSKRALKSGQVTIKTSVVSRYMSLHPDVHNTKKEIGIFLYVLYIRYIMCHFPSHGR